MTNFSWTNVVDNVTDVLATHPNTLAIGVWDAMNGIRPGGRLTLTSGTPVTTSDVTGATNVYYCPYLSDSISLWDGSAEWLTISFAEKTLALGTVTSGLPYDIFGYLSSGALALEKLAWTNGTTRATAISLQDGRYCKTGDKTRLYLGTLYTTSTSATEDSIAKRYLWNMYNRELRSWYAQESTATWNYTTGTWRQANASGTNQINCIVGLAQAVIAEVICTLLVSGNAARGGYVAVGANSTSTPTGGRGGASNTSGSLTIAVPAFGLYQGVLAAGYNYLAWIEKGADTGCTFYGASADGSQSGIYGQIWS